VNDARAPTVRVDDIGKAESDGLSRIEPITLPVFAANDFAVPSLPGFAEEQHAGEVDKMLRKPGDVEASGLGPAALIHRSRSSIRAIGRDGSVKTTPLQFRRGQRDVGAAEVDDPAMPGWRSHHPACRAGAAPRRDRVTCSWPPAAVPAPESGEAGQERAASAKPGH
jgi:hypothetical protein